MQQKCRGFTLVEIMVVMALVVVIGGFFAALMINSSKSILRISNQAELNNTASHVAMLIVKRTRAARLVEVSEDGNMLTLTYDDDVDVDTDDDGDFYNDTDHVEVFTFYNTDDDASTYEDNGITYLAVADGSAQTLVTNVKLMANTPAFALDVNDPRKVDVSFELKLQSTDGQSQRIDIVTSAYCLNMAGGSGVAGPSGGGGSLPGGGSGGSGDADDHQNEEPAPDVEAAKKKLKDAEAKLQKELEKLDEELKKLAKEVEKLAKATKDKDKEKAQKKVDEKQEKVNEAQKKVDKEQANVDQAQKELEEAQSR